MSNDIQNTGSDKLDQFIRSCSNKETAWRFFLRRNLRSEAFYGNGNCNIVIERRSRKIDVLKDKFETAYGRYFVEMS